MHNTFFRTIFLLLGFVVFSAVSIASEEISLPSAPKTSSPSDELSYSVYDQNEPHFFLSSSKEDVTGQFSHQKVKFISPNFFPTAKINYRYTHVFYQNVLSRSFVLGRTTALRAPPTFLLS
jgi:hypothetical protein